MDHDHLDFPQAVEDLAKRAGMEVPREDSRARPAATPDRATRRSTRCSSAAADYYRQALKSHPARQGSGGLPQGPRPVRGDRPRLRPGLRPARLGQPDAASWAATACSRRRCSTPAC